MPFDIEPLTFLEIARRELKVDPLPTPIKDGLNTIFTKRANANLYRGKILDLKAQGIKQNKYPIKQGRKYSVRNILIIWYLFDGDTKKTKCFLEEYCMFKSTKCELDITHIVEKTKKQYLEYFSLGVISEKIDKIVRCLKSQDFDFFSEKLPSPFSNEKNDMNDISPIVIMFEDIPWERYMSLYKEAEQHFIVKEYLKAQEILKILSSESIIRLPVIELLMSKIYAEESESKEAWDYLKNILN
ncbi:hypothetical protein GCM10008107_05190 [Psychrosphaera saromensis]|uniref:Uncharacterized protein n=1 Tax=Psychrosphaera saromensis TaxID=716813 RepID=A0A2S7UXP7_9GAMM|nr:hypothetical protein [Psychrosphaera saromensis]PQJ54549.1 hypothetical protein BTO11_13430 [Psychrosphaera saromensis]GHB59029.1 hypothetical protein GCM10008107_05190 [Psychrosphaera saromensis]GLQ14240.1 hypothetical protein GCM10007917_16950 [Psychrosphaera saromensis]